MKVFHLCFFFFFGRIKVCQGPYDAALIQAWEDWDDKHCSENDNPKEFPENQVTCPSYWCSHVNQIMFHLFRFLTPSFSVPAAHSCCLLHKLIIFTHMPSWKHALFLMYFIFLSLSSVVYFHGLGRFFWDMMIVLFMIDVHLLS